MIGAGVNDACSIFMLGSSFKAFVFAFFLGLLLSGNSSAQSSRPTQLEQHSSYAQQGLVLARAGRCDRALSVFRKALPQQLADKDLSRQVGFAGVRCSMSENRLDAALEFLHFLNREFPHDPDVLYVSVHTYSDLSTAAAQELAATAPNSSQARELNAEALELQGKWDQAAKEYQQVLEENPRLPGIHFRLARLLLSRPNPTPSVAQDAKRELLQEIDIDPSNAEAEYILGELARQESGWTEAIEHFTRATKLDAGFADAYIGLGVSLISLKRFSDAVVPLETAVKLQPRNPAAHYDLAMAYNRAGRKQDADREFALHRQMTATDGNKSDAPSGIQPEKSN
jgi:tetratricopeptide (TPR) repeat protein